jgi:uncharacterized protein YkwD
MSMMRRSGQTVLAVVLIAGVATPASPGPVPETVPMAFAPSAPESGSGFATVVVSLTNAERRKAGLPPYRQNAQLAQAAQLHAEQMASKGQMDHALRGVRYPNPADRLAAVGYQWGAYAENVAMGQRNPPEVVGSWMRSPGHRGNMLAPDLTEMGAGYATDSAGRGYWVQVFGRQ